VVVKWFSEFDYSACIMYFKVIINNMVWIFIYPTSIKNYKKKLKKLAKFFFLIFIIFKLPTIIMGKLFIFIKIYSSWMIFPVVF